MKKMIMLFMISMFIACGSEVSSDGNTKSSNGNKSPTTSNNSNTNTNNNNQTNSPGTFLPPVADSGISKPKV